MCGGLTPKNRRKKFRYCSYECRKKDTVKRFNAINGKPLGLHKTTVGTTYELLVSVDLIRRGYEVYRAVDHGCPNDLAVARGKKFLLVQVTAAWKNFSGKLRYRPHKKGGHHVIAAVQRSGEITYIPPLD